MKNVVVLTGAGISAESGLKTFRDANGLWEGHDVMEVASPVGWQRDPQTVLEFYNQRRRQLLKVEPNAAHFALADLERNFEVNIITQNVDDLHERAGSSKVLHLHGELLKVRSTFDANWIMDWRNDLNIGDFCEHHHQLRPHIVWFGEEVPLFPVALEMTEQADIVVIIGTSMQVYPAATLLDYAREDAEIFFIDPNPALRHRPDIKMINKTASIGVPQLINEFLKN